MHIITMSESYIALKKEELITINERILQNMDFLLYLYLFHGKTFYSMLQNQSNKILLCWFLSLSSIEQIKNFKTLNTGLVISSNADKIQYFMKLRLHKLISQWLNLLHLWCVYCWIKSFASSHNKIALDL